MILSGQNLRFISVIFFPAGGKNQCNIISQNEKVTYLFYFITEPFNHHSEIYVLKRKTRGDKDAIKEKGNHPPNTVTVAGRGEDVKEIVGGRFIHGAMEGKGWLKGGSLTP